MEVSMDIETLFSVKNKIILVTVALNSERSNVKGGGSGIGRMITEGFVRNGAKVYICSRKKETIQSTADALTKRGILENGVVDDRAWGLYCASSRFEFI
jgi:NADP-dependent 3-hydroxy acid dehydrogenase YdfG